MVMNRKNGWPRSACAWAAALLAASPGLATAQQARVSEVLVYPGGAEVTRVMSLVPGSQEAVFACIPARIQLDALQARGSASLQVGEISVQTLPSAAAPECSGNPQLDTQIRALEDQKAGLAAERGALDIVLGYLKQSGDAKAPALPAAAESLRRQGLEALRQQHQLQRRIEAVDEQLKPLLAQRKTARGGVDSWHRIAVRVQGQGELSLVTRTALAGWQPVYRADLDSASGRIAFERRAEVQQASGENWDNVRLRLSTRQPQRAMAMPDPQPWLLSKYEPPPMARSRDLPMAAAPMAAKAQQLESVSVTGSRIDADLPSFSTDFDLQFAVPGAVTLANGSERRSFTLERLNWTGELYTRVQPQVQAQGFLVAELKRPEGFFPAGKLLLARDGEYVGESFFELGDEASQQLSFGPDDRLRVRAEPERRDAANSGFIGSRRVIQLGRSYLLENLGSKPLRLQVIEAGPHAQHADIEVEARFEPAPQQQRWRDLDGVRLWSLQLAPRQQQRLQADYRLSAPRDLQVIGWP